MLCEFTLLRATLAWRHSDHNHMLVMILPTQLIAFAGMPECWCHPQNLVLVTRRSSPERLACETINTSGAVIFVLSDQG